MTEGLDLPDPELGKATIVYETLDDEREVLTVDNEHILYFQDHWQVRSGEDAEGNDVVRRIPRERVHHVERSVEEFRNRIDELVARAREKLDVDLYSSD